MGHVIGVDIGTSGIKAGAMDPAGTLCYITTASYSLKYPEPDRIEIDLDEIWEKVVSVILETIHKVKQSGSSVTAISFSTFCNASVLMDRDGTNIGNGILYMDHRSKQEAEWVKQTIPEEQLFSITGNRIEPGMISVCTLLWLKGNKPDLFENAYRWGHLPTFLIAKMTGDFVLDWTQASYTGLFDINNYQWSDELCKKLGIDQSLLPNIVSPTEIVGSLKPSLSEYFGIPQVPVVAGAADTACSSFVLGTKPGEVFESSGTSDVLTVATNTTAAFDPRFLNRCYVLPGQWISHGAMSTPGLAIQWFYQEFLQRDGSLQEVFVKYPELSTIGSNGVFFLPYMHGERSPIWDSNARGLFVGLSVNTTKADMTRAILEGCAFGLRQLLDIIQEELNIHPSVIPCVGGGSKNTIWCQIKADVLNTVIETREVQETALLGACYLAAYALKDFTLQDINDISETKMTRMAVYKPQVNSVEKYDKFYELFKQLYPSLKSFYHQVASSRS